MQYISGLIVGYVLVTLFSGCTKQGEAKMREEHTRFKHDYTSALSKEQIASFLDKGFTISRSSALFTQEELQEIEEAGDSVYKGAERLLAELTMKAETDVKDGCDKQMEFRVVYPGVRGETASILAVKHDNAAAGIKLISWAGGVNPRLIDFGQDERITIPVAQLLSSDRADHLINQLHYKMPYDGITYAWHQDIQNRRSFDKNWKNIHKDRSFVQVLTAINESTENNGPLIVISGSHKKDLGLGAIRDEKDKVAAIIKEYGDVDKVAKPILLQPGDTLFMHQLLVHKSDVNQSNQSRKLFINGFAYPGANHEPYPGEGSAQAITLKIPADLLQETEAFLEPH